MRAWRFELQFSWRSKPLNSESYVFIVIYIFFKNIFILLCILGHLEATPYTGWNDKIFAQEKTTWFHFRLMKTGFPFLFFFFFFFVADHLLVGQLCTNPKSDRSLLSYLKVTQCLTSEIGDALLYNTCSLPIQVMTTGLLPDPSKYKSGRFDAWGHSSTHRTTL